jgi:hypothetical protein
VGHLARSLATVPRQGYDWYVFLVEDSFDDELRRQLRSNFEQLGKAVGPNALVVKAFDPDQMADEWSRLGVRPPALVVADHVPAYDAPSAGRRIELGLNAEFVKSHSIVGLLQELVKALHDPEAMHVLETAHAEPGKIRTFWGWLGKYTEIKPNFMGFGINGNAIIAELADRG